MAAPGFATTIIQNFSTIVVSPTRSSPSVIKFPRTRSSSSTTPFATPSIEEFSSSTTPTLSSSRSPAPDFTSLSVPSPSPSSSPVSRTETIAGVVAAVVVVIVIISVVLFIRRRKLAQIRAKYDEGFATPMPISRSNVDLEKQGPIPVSLSSSHSPRATSTDKRESTWIDLPNPHSPAPDGNASPTFSASTHHTAPGFSDAPPPSTAPASRTSLAVLGFTSAQRIQHVAEVKNGN